jgi:hypothetical protein
MRTENGIEDEWDGWQGQRLLGFINAHAGLRPPLSEADLPTATPAGQPPEARVMPEPTPDHLTKPGSAPSVNPPVGAPPQAIVIATSAGGPTFQESASTPAQTRAASGILCANQPFKVHLALDRAEMASPKMRPLNYKANIYAKSFKGRLCQPIGEADGRLEPTGTATIIMDGSPLAQGLYRLQAVVSLTDSAKQSKHQTSSTFQTGEKLLRIA